MLEAKGVTEFNEVEMVLSVFGVTRVVPAGEDEPGGGSMSEGAGEEGECADC